LINGCRSNDRCSQEKLYKLFFQPYYALCKRFFNDKHEALTALNNGMLNIFKNIESFDPQKGEFYNWGYTIIRHAALSIIKKNVNTLPVTEFDSQIADETSYYNLSLDEDVSLISNLLILLPLTCRTVCQLFYLEDYSIKEICDELTMKEGTVKWYLSDARNRLKTLLDKQK